MHSDDRHRDGLPAEPDPGLSPGQIAALRSLGGERAPAELAARVGMIRAERLSAPPELWQRVAADLGFGRPQARPTRTPTRIRAWPRSLTAAAGILMLGGIAWLTWPAASDNPALTGGNPVLAAAVSPERQRALRARLVVIEVSPERLSPTTRAFSEFLGGPAAPRPDLPEEG